MGKFCQIFVCATPGEGRCGAKGGGELLEAFKEEVDRRGIRSSAVLRNACTRRHEEDAARAFFDEHGHWPDETLEEAEAERARIAAATGAPTVPLSHPSSDGLV